MRVVRHESHRDAPGYVHNIQRIRSRLRFGRDAEGTTVSGYHGRGLHGQIVEAVGRSIVHGSHAEGDTLDLEALQRGFGVSLTVVREALKVLAAKGLVDARPKRGTFVLPRRSWNLLDSDVLLWEMTSGHLPQMLAQLAEVRAIVEPATAALAAERRDETDLADLRSSFASMRDADDITAMTDADLRFHRAVTRAANNDLLERVEMLTRSLFAERDTLVHQHIAAAEALGLHRTLLETIEAGDTAGAREAAERIVGRATRDEAASLPRTRATTRRTAREI